MVSSIVSKDFLGYGRPMDGNSDGLALYDIGAFEYTGAYIPIGDITPPSRSNGSPSGTLSSGATQTTISLSTDESATCKYSASAGTNYASMANTFTTTSSTSHSQTITGLSNGNSYAYYIRCMDEHSNANTSDYTISFSVASPLAAPENQAPLVNAGTDQTITLPTNQVSLVPTIIDDDLPDPPKIITYQWVKVSGAGTVTFTNAQVKNTIATFSTNGTYVLRITASDSLLSASDDIGIVVNPAPSNGGGSGGSAGGGSSGSGSAGSGASGGSSSGTSSSGNTSTTQADTTAPNTITNIRISNVKENSITLNWTAPGDDNTQGQAKVYEIRYSTSPITNTNWTTSKQVTNVNAPKISGNGESLVIQNLESDKTYYFAVRAKDEANNWSEISAIATGKTLKVAQTNTINNTNTNTQNTANNNSTTSGSGSTSGCNAKNVNNLYGIRKEIAECVSREEARKIDTHNQAVDLDVTGKKLYMDIVIKSTKTLTSNNKYSLAEFIHEGTETTKRLGSGERAGVINSYQAAFNKIPQTEAEWQDVVKIANGRWPMERNNIKEKNAEVIFKKIYARAPNMANANDNAAVTIITYGLRPAVRNTESEKAGIKIFKGIYGYNPALAEDWDIVRAIAYSGAKR